MNNPIEVTKRPHLSEPLFRRPTVAAIVTCFQQISEQDSVTGTRVFTRSKVRQERCLVIWTNSDSVQNFRMGMASTKKQTTVRVSDMLVVAKKTLEYVVRCTQNQHTRTVALSSSTWTIFRFIFTFLVSASLLKTPC